MITQLINSVLFRTLHVSYNMSQGQAGVGVQVQTTVIFVSVFIIATQNRQVTGLVPGEIKLFPPLATVSEGKTRLSVDIGGLRCGSGGGM